MNREQLLNKLLELEGDADWERGRALADRLICQFLVELGYEDIATVFARI